MTLKPRSCNGLQERAVVDTSVNGENRGNFRDQVSKDHGWCHSHRKRQEGRFSMKSACAVAQAGTLELTSKQITTHYWRI